MVETAFVTTTLFFFSQDDNAFVDEPVYELADAYMVQHQQQQRQSNLITTPTAAAEATAFLRSESGRVSGFPF